MDFGQVIFNAVICGLIAWVITRWLFRGHRVWFLVIWIVLTVLSLIPGG